MGAGEEVGCPGVKPKKSNKVPKTQLEKIETLQQSLVPCENQSVVLAMWFGGRGLAWCTRDPQFHSKDCKKKK